MLHRDHSKGVLFHSMHKPASHPAMFTANFLIMETTRDISVQLLMRISHGIVTEKSCVQTILSYLSQKDIGKDFRRRYAKNGNVAGRDMSFWVEAPRLYWI